MIQWTLSNSRKWCSKTPPSVGGSVYNLLEASNHCGKQRPEDAAFLVVGDENKTKLHSPMPVAFDELYRDFTYTGKRNPL